jgi:transcriptional regulator with XRE-family HTH domain
LHKNGLVENPAKLGEDLRNRRLILGLTQERAAFRLGTIREVYERWERDERKPVVSVWPSIIAFLGYYPHGATSANLALTIRRSAGLDQKKLAKKAGVMHQRLRDWEREREQPSAEQLRRLKEIAKAVAQVSKPSSGITD